MATAVAAIMVVAGFFRVLLFGGTLRDAYAIACALLAIVFISIIVGALLPLGLHAVRLCTFWPTAARNDAL